MAKGATRVLRFEQMFSRAVPVTALAFAFSACVLVGCAKPETVADRQFAEMREQVTKMETERDRVDERLSALEIAVADQKSNARATPASPIPPARVVQVGDPAETDGADPNDKTDRPDIRVTGAAGSSSTPRGRAGKTASNPALDLDAKPAYDAALALVQQRQYDRGLEALNAFLVRFPDHPYVENAMYWRGEAYFAQNDYAHASEQFEAVLARFGTGKKAPDALLKLGMCQDRLGQPARAHEYYDRLKNDYPKSDAAKRIPSVSGAGIAAPKGPKENR